MQVFKGFNSFTHVRTFHGHSQSIYGEFSAIHCPVILHDYARHARIVAPIVAGYMLETTNEARINETFVDHEKREEY